MTLRATFVLFVSLWWPQSAHADLSEIPGDFPADAISYSDSAPVHDRLAQIAFRILVANAELCGRDTTWTLGMSTASPYAMDGWAPVENDAYPTVVSMIAGSPALASGLRLGDQILAFNGEYLPPGYFGADLLSHLLHENQARVLHLAFDRDGLQGQVIVRPIRVCSYDIILSEDDEENALAQENRVLLTTGMLNFLAKDDDVAIVLAHEVAHIAAGHTGYGPEQHAQDVEPEADYLGVYLAARAGYDVSGAGDLLQRIANLRGEYYGHGGVAGIDRRLQAIKAAVTEVRTKRAAGQFLDLSPGRLLNHDRLPDYSSN